MTAPSDLRERLEERWRAVRLQAAQARSFLTAVAADRLRPGPGPRLDGELRVPGVTAEVEILRDANGVPHCFAQSEADALFALGYVHAQDRAWQMEFYRRVVQGRISEIVGPEGLDTDRLMRRIGIHRVAAAAWDAMDPDLQSRFEPYMRGINAAFEREPLPLEFRILDCEPEPWRPQDSVLWSKMLSFMLAPAWEVQVLRAQVLEEAGLAALEAVDPGYHHEGPVIGPPGAPYGALAEDIAEARRHQAGTLLGAPGLGSNNWAVAPAQTSTGRALFACDPHLSAVFPSNGYFAHLHCPEFDAAGASVPGLPGIIWGFNRRIAWGPTAGLASVQDAVVEEFEEGTHRYRTETGWSEAEVVPELIQVRGGRPLRLEVQVTRHGPIVSPELPRMERAVALRSSILQPTTSGRGLLGLLSAGNVEEFREAVAGFLDFNLTWGYADVDGHIGVQTSGQVPKRRPGEAWMPQAGWADCHTLDDDSYVPFDELPHAFDPPEGFAWSANNAPAPVEELAFDGEFLDRFRATRIGELLRERAPHSPATARAMQPDRVSLPMRELRERLLAIEPADQHEQELLDLIADWDGSMEPDSVPAALVAATFSRLYDAVLWGQLRAASSIFTGDAHAIPNLNMMAARGASLVLRRLEESPAGWFGSGAVPSGMEPGAVWQAALQRAFRDALALLEERLGSDPAKWTWGRCHRLTLRHSLHDAPATARLFDVGPLPFGGDSNTVFQAGPLGRDPFAPVDAIPALRLIVDLSEPPQAEFTLAGGQSERRGAAHHHDLLDDWAHGRTRPLRTDAAQVRAEAVHALRLLPPAEAGDRR